MTQWAREKFQVGDRVTMTAPALRQGLNGTSDRRNGVIKGCGWAKQSGITGEDGDRLVRVRRDGDAATKTYHMDFWELVVASPSGE